MEVGSKKVFFCIEIYRWYIGADSILLHKFPFMRSLNICESICIKHEFLPKWAKTRNWEKERTYTTPMTTAMMEIIYIRNMNGARKRFYYILWYWFGFSVCFYFDYIFNNKNIFFPSILHILLIVNRGKNRIELGSHRIWHRIDEKQPTKK